MQREAFCVADVVGALSRLTAKVESLERSSLERLARIERTVERAADQPQVLTFPAAARMLSCGVTTLKGMIRDKKIQTVDIGRRRMVPLSEILRLTIVTSSPKGAPSLPLRPAKLGQPSRAQVSQEASELREQLRKR